MTRSDRIAVGLVVLGGVLTGLASYAILRAAHTRVAPWYCVGLGIVVLALLRIAAVAARATESPPILAHGPTQGRAVPAEVVAPLERRLAAAAQERRLFIAGLQPRLLALSRERIALRRGADLDTALRDGTARELLGEPLWFWLTVWDEDGPPPTERELNRLVTDLERL